MKTIKNSMLEKAERAISYAESNERNAAEHSQSAIDCINQAAQNRKEAAEWTRLANEQADD